MTSAIGISEADAPARPALRNAGGILDMKAMGLAARLASSILNPVNHVDPCSLVAIVDDTGAEFADLYTH